MLVDGRLSAGHARALLTAPESARGVLAQRAVDEALTVRALERFAAAGSRKTPSRPALRALSPEEADFESRLRARFGTHVAVVRYRRGGRIEFRFSSDDELIRLGDLLLSDEA
jgi:ParB family chromosome partitioning protein